MVRSDMTSREAAGRGKQRKGSRCVALVKVEPDRKRVGVSKHLDVAEACKSPANSSAGRRRSRRNKPVPRSKCEDAVSVDVFDLGKLRRRGLRVLFFLDDLGQTRLDHFALRLPDLRCGLWREGSESR